MLSTYDRGQRIPLRRIGDKKTRTQLKQKEKKIHAAVERAVEAETLLPDTPGFLEPEGLERTFQFKQAALLEQVDEATAEKAFTLDLPDLGPYAIDYTRNGRHVLLGGRKGHVATFDWQTSKLKCELQLQETVRDVKWLHNELFFAVAQKEAVYIYDHTGMEIHHLKKHVQPYRLEFLPYHFLLASIGNPGMLMYQDTSTGQVVAELKTKQGRCEAMRQNSRNAILHCGHASGVVTLWAPNMTTPLVKMACHRGPVLDIAIDRSGYQMATTGMDGQLKLWDLRTYKPLQQYFTRTPAKTVDISHTGLLAVGSTSYVTVWQDAFKTKQTSPYMNHHQPSSAIEKLRFCPFEDVLGAGHANGFSSLIIPGAGEAHYDALELNPYQTPKQRQEGEVRALLDKIQPDAICLNPDVIGNVDRVHEDVRKEDRLLEMEANLRDKESATSGAAGAAAPKKRARGRNTALRRYLNRQRNVIDAKKEAVRQRLEQERKARQKERQRQAHDAGDDHNDNDDAQPVSAVDRFRSTA